MIPDGAQMCRLNGSNYEFNRREICEGTRNTHIASDVRVYRMFNAVKITRLISVSDQTIDRGRP